MTRKRRQMTSWTSQAAPLRAVPQEAAVPLPQAYVELLVCSDRDANEKRIESLLIVCQ